MAKKLDESPISAEDLLEFVKTEDDFAFELRVFQACRKADARARHGGTYQDPITGANRQFDLRVCLTEVTANLALAIECKNLGRHFPLLVSRVPRLREEAYHNVMECRLLDFGISEKKGFKTIYSKGEMVGKATIQVGKAADRKERPLAERFESNDAAVYEKWSQAISSSFDLLKDAATRSNDLRFTIVMPVLVVPENTLWVVDYAEDGTRLTEPAVTDECTFFLGKSYDIKMPDASILNYTLSHLHIVTMKGLNKLLRFDEDLVEDLFFAR